MSDSDDTIPVRAEEAFDEGRLAAYLRDRLEGAQEPLTVRQFGGGVANLTYLLDFRGRQYVLRRPPLGPVAKGAHDVGREWRALAALHAAYPLAPRALVLCEDAEVMGAPFLVMERRRGLVVRHRMPRAYEGKPEAPARISEALVDALADLHTVDYARCGLGDLGRPKGFLDRQIEGWFGRWEKARLDDVPAMDEVHGWLVERRPREKAPGLVHGDYKLDNVMLDPGDPGRVVAVLDWDMCTLGDPLADLGSLLGYWTEPGDPASLRAMATMPQEGGFLTRTAITERYARRSGRDTSGIAFYHVLGLFRLAVIAAQIFVRYRRGQTRDPRFEALGPLVPVVAGAARQVAARI